MSALINNTQIHAIVDALTAQRKLGRAIRQRSGIAYLGQFISHDIVPATNPARQSRTVTPFLNLDSVYGDNDEYLPADGVFPIRPVYGVSGTIAGYDVPRKRDEKGGYPADIAEARNDDVLIVTQLHAFFQRLHNAIFRSGYAFDSIEAKELTIKVFQILVVEEFCKNILDKDVFKTYFKLGRSDYNLWDKSKIPAFFSKAAFRFGHSMVSPEYKLNSHSSSISLSKLFTTNQKLDASKAIDWTLFFNEKLKGGQPSMKIDTKFALTMERVSPIDGSFDPINLMIKNLASGESAGLPTGLEVAEQVYKMPRNALLKDKSLWFKDYSTGEFAELIKKHKGSNDIARLPLWPFILVEAELAGGKHYKHKKYPECLGKVGSTLVAEVLVNAIARSKESIFVDGKYNLDSALINMGVLGKLLRPDALSSFSFNHLVNKLTEIEEKNHD